MKSRNLLKSLLLLLLVEFSRQEAGDTVCEKGFRWSRDLERCKDCRLCEISSKDDFCQTCDSEDKQADFPLLWVIVSVAVAAFLFTFIITLTVYLIHCRRKNKFTTPIEETGAHSAEELLIH
ncbi:PREDICTED: tumor necrosis factor receptor superfamily member 12A [Nanorana parkeri]|uniref:tumor necrosis factor receptor superfamily member 12A n=1 Tax=Nanorana parkeri TaxID=125878 RepID=UPI000854F48C|nr:PREDICTED: tumor necrosis factor receptor superfamily member 12A [Nanorana parkeri]